jgi:hypothetical protein
METAATARAATARAATARLVTARTFTKGSSGLQITPVKVTPDTRNFGRGKRTPKASNNVFGGVTLVDTDDSDDEIMIVSEKITPKTKLKLIQKQQKRTASGSSSVLVKKQIVGSGSLLRKPTDIAAKNKEAAVTKTEDNLDDDDDDLTCRVCLSSFWYKNEVMDHLQSVHSVKDPEAFLRQKSRV